MIALGTDSGPILAPFWNPKTDQIGPKRVPKSIKKVIEKHVEFGIDFLTMFGQFWLPTWRARGVQRIRVSASSRLPEPPWGPNGPQAPSKLDFWSILIDFWSILGRFWIDLGMILGRFWVRCWSIFVWLLMDNVTSLTNLTNLTNLTPGTVAGLARRASGY